ncbi:hypothetical protein ACFQ95_13600 [Variovorax sp. HJSM1_2]
MEHPFKTKAKNTRSFCARPAKISGMHARKSSAENVWPPGLHQLKLKPGVEQVFI